MNADTFAIAQFETEEDAIAAGHSIPLGAEEAAELGPLTRAQRRAVHNRRIGATMDALAAQFGKLEGAEQVKAAAFAKD